MTAAPGFLRTVALAAAATLAALASCLLILPAAAHDAVGSDAQSPPLGHGGTYMDTAHASGNVLYHCHIHPRMVGLLHISRDVDPAGPATHRIVMRDDGNATDLAAMAFVDNAGSNVTVAHLGDTLLWTNQGTLTHDVHIVWSAVAPADSGSFEVWVAAGLVLVLTAIFAASRRI